MIRIKLIGHMLLNLILYPIDKILQLMLNTIDHRIDYMSHCIAEYRAISRCAEMSDQTLDRIDALEADLNALTDRNILAQKRWDAIPFYGYLLLTERDNRHILNEMEAALSWNRLFSAFTDPIVP
jgi:hypothetical protein